MDKKWVLEAGDRFPNGATARSGGVNFSVFSRRATRVWLRLYRGATDPTPLVEIELDPHEHRTYAWWHVFVVGAQPGWYYTWRADGPPDPLAEPLEYLSSAGPPPDWNGSSQSIRNTRPPARGDRSRGAALLLPSGAHARAT